MKKVMIVGAGQGQINMLKICQQRGYDVFVVSIPGDYPCFKLTDNVRYADILDKDAVLHIAQEEKIDAVISDQSDIAVPTVAYVAEKMGLRGIGYNTALKFTNKFLMRQAAKEVGVAVPEFYQAKTLDEAMCAVDKIGFPLIIKPVDGWSSRGVHKVNSLSEFENSFIDSLSFSIEKTVIIEKFINGKEYLADGFAIENEYINLDVGEKEYFDLNNTFVSKTCVFYSPKLITDRVKKMVLDTNRKVFKKMGLDFGITFGEFIYCPNDDKVYLVEIAARGGGVNLSTDITPTASGFNSNEALIDYVVEGKIPNITESNLSALVSAWIGFGLPKGEILSVSGLEEISKINGVVIKNTEELYIGKKTNGIRNDDDRYAPFLVLGVSENEYKEIYDKIKKTFIIKVKTIHGIKYQIW